jgi:pimeloyl-ACP methyl ester carboxylesterase
MADYVLVHGGNMSADTWNRLAGRIDYAPGSHLGAKYWDGTAAFLRAHGHRAFIPTLEDENSSTLTRHIEQVCALIADNDLKDIILVGHSYGGMVITGVAARMRDRIRRLVYLDAALPDPGQSLYDILNIGLASSAGPRPALPDPATPYVEKLRYDPALLRSLPKTYILCTKSEFKNVTRIAKQKIAAAPQGWTYLELPSSHVPMADLPDKLYRLMLDAALK